MEKRRRGDLDVGLIDLDELKKLSEKEIRGMWNQVGRLQWKKDY